MKTNADILALIELGSIGTRKGNSIKYFIKTCSREYKSRIKLNMSTKAK